MLLRRFSLALVLLLALVFASAMASNGGRPIASPDADLTGFAPVGTQSRQTALGTPGDVVNFGTAVTLGGNYLKKMQADVTEDNAGNGSGGSESPNDPDDAGWDWVVTSPPAPFFHTTAASASNIYGATVLGLYYAYLETNDATYFTALTDAANWIRDHSAIRTASDMKFLMLYDDLPAVAGTVYQDTAKARYDYRIGLYGSATAFAQYIRDTRGVTQGYPNGIIGWDIGIYAVVAQMLYARYGGTYDVDADAIAEVLWQDSFNSNPGYFDVVADAGWDPTWTNVNYWWYTLGISGLLDAFSASGSHTAEIPGLIARIQASQFTNGAISGSYGANATDEDWQSTAYCIMSLNSYDASTYATEIQHGAYWTAVTQDVSGGWLYGASHYPEIGGEALSIVTLGVTPSVVWVDPTWTSQAAVDAYNTANSTNYLWGYDAFGTIANGILGVAVGGTVNVLPGTYVLSSTVNVNKPNVTIDGAGAGLSIVQVSAAVGYAFNLSTAGVTLRDLEIQKTDLVTNHALIYVAANNLSILNNLIYGPDPGTPWATNGIVSRAMIGTGGLSGLLIDGNTIHTLRQPGYFSGPTTGTISNNAVSGTRGWVNEGANLTFTNNSWPLPPNQGAEIALLATLGANGPIWYPDPMALSLANNNAYVDAQFTPSDKGRAVSYVDDSAAPGGFGSSLAPLQTIGTAVSSGVLATGTVNVAAGNYVENLVVAKPMSLLGAGSVSTFVVPALSAPNPGGGGSLPPGASNMVLVQANNVLINGFTFDGDNPALTSTYNVGGANLDARNGIITNHPLGVYNNLTVEYCTIKNIYLRAVYASSGGTFNFHHNVVDNVQGESASIGMFNFGGAGIFDHNTVSNCNDAIASNWSKGCNYTYNVVTGSGSGVHTDNAGNYAGSTADLIENNNISNSPANGYGIFVFAPYIAPTVNLNTITNVDIALTCAGSYQSPLPVVQFTNNIADGMGKPNSAGIYVTTDIWGYASGNVAVNFANNSFSNFVEGAYLVAESGKTATAVLTNNDFLQNGLGISNGVGMTYTGPPNVGMSVNATLNLFVNTANATDNKTGNFYDQNCWGDWSGVGTYLVGGAGGNIDANPSNSCGMDMTPNTIVYNCAGNFEYDVNIGDGVTALDAANVWLTYPADLTVASVTALDGNFFVAYTQSTNILNTRDTLKVNLGVLTGVTDGPDGLFKVAMNGSVSCLSGDIEMVYLDLRDSTNSPIVVPMATPIDFQSNCADPTIVVNSPATGGFYNTNPVLSLTAGDDCDLDAVYYQIDGCTPGGWLPIATGLSGTAYNNAAWSMTPAQFTALSEASHCIRFKVTDDFGRANSDSCTYTWCFTKDITAPAAPTALVAQPGHNKIQLTWTNSSSADVVGVKIQRVPWTSYPDYGSVPTLTPAPAYPANHGVGTTVHTAAATPSSSASHLDVMGLSNATRDIYYFGAFAYDAAGNYSVAAVPAQARATSYWLGDIAASFDGNVYFPDLVVFTSTYGVNEGQGGYVNHADFGPTHNNSPKGIPLPDDMVEFEDLAIFAINFNNVAPMAAKNSPTMTGSPIEPTAGLKLVDRLANDGYYVDLYLSNRSNDAKSLIGEISFDQTQLTFVSATIGADLANPSLPIFYKPLVGENKVSISAAVLGQGSAFTGSGVIATLKFQTRSAAAPRARLTRAEIRDNENNSIIEQIHIVEQPEPISEVALPTNYTVGQNSPNPFNPETSISYGLPTATKVSIRIYNVMGQLVRTLVDEYQAAGTHEVIWNGTTDTGSKVASGIYFYRFETADFQKTVKMTMLK